MFIGASLASYLSLGSKGNRSKRAAEYNMLLNCSFQNPNCSVQTDIIELMNIKMPNKLDNIRKILLDLSLNNDDNFKSFFNKNIEKIINKDEIIEKLLNITKFKSQTEAKQKLLRIFNINKIGAIKKEIEELKNQLLSTADDKLMKKMLYLKEYEKQIKDEIAN